jgi:hypothetical protein
MLASIPIALTLSLVSWAAAAAEPAKRFEIVMVFTDRATALLRHHDNPNGIPLNLESIKVVPRGRHVAALVLFKNCRPDDKGMCNIELDTIAHTPEGKVYGYRTDSQFWYRKPEPGPGYLQMGRRALGLVIDRGDPAGTWRVTATARDRIANAEASAEWRFEVEPE